MTDATRDYYRRLAKNAGYRSRSAYKLLQLNRSYGIFRPRHSVVDLGSAPGGWLQVAKQQVGVESLVVGRQGWNYRTECLQRGVVSEDADRVCCDACVVIDRARTGEVDCSCVCQCVSVCVVSL